jgi:Protein of unknown function (DUF998)
MGKAVITTKPVSAVAANAARVSIASGVLFVLLLGSLHLLEPEFNPSWRFLSEYELGNFGWMMRLAFLALATSLASAGLAISSQARTAVGYIGVTGLGIAAVGLVIAAVFRTDPATTSREAATFSGKMHVFGASLDYTPVAALLVSFSLARNMAWRPIRKWLYISVGITWVALTAFMATLPYDGKIGPGLLAGLFGRLLLVSYLGWLITVGAYAMKLQKQTGVH